MRKWRCRIQGYVTVYTETGDEAEKYADGFLNSLEGLDIDVMEVDEAWD